MDLTVAQLTPLAAAPALMVVASLCERRWGSHAAGLVAGAPVALFVGVLVVAADLGPRAGQEFALSTSSHVLAQAMLALGFFHVAQRSGAVAGVVAATGAYVCCSLLTVLLPPLVAVALGVVAAVLGRVLLGPVESGPASPGVTGRAAATDLVLRAGVALVATTGLVTAAHVFGPSVGGAVGAYPVFSVVLACLVGSARGRRGLRDVLRGLVRALPAYQAFGVTYWGGAPLVGGLGGVAAAVGVCCLTYAAVTRTSSGRSAPGTGTTARGSATGLAARARATGHRAATCGGGRADPPA